MAKPGDSIRKQIWAEVLLRLGRITVANGFRTDAGQTILRGVLARLSETDPDAVLAVLPHDESNEHRMLNIVGHWPIEIIGIANASINRDDAWMVAEDILADIQTAMEQNEDRRFGGLLGHNGMTIGPVRTFMRDTASDVVAVSQTYEFDVQRVFGMPAVGRK